MNLTSAGERATGENIAIRRGAATQRLGPHHDEMIIIRCCPGAICDERHARFIPFAID
jgi:hypothetical protein